MNGEGVQVRQSETIAAAASSSRSWTPAPTPRRATGAVWRSGLWILSLALVGAVIGALIGERTPARYSSAALLLASPLEQSVLGFDPATSGLSSELVVLDTSIQLMMSPAHLQAVAEELLSSDDTADVVRAMEADSGLADLYAASPAAALREFIDKNLTVRQQGRADIISVSFLSTDPNVAARVANAVGITFLENQAAARRAETDQIRQQLEARIGTLEEDARRSGSLAQAYAAEAGLLIPRESQEEVLSQMTVMLLEAEAERETLAGRLKALRDLIASGTALSEDPDVRSSERIRELQAQPASGEAGATGDLIRQEIERIEADLELRLDMAARRVESLRGALEALQEQVTERAQAESELDLLRRDAVATSEMYSQMLNRLQEISAEEAFIGPDLRLVSPAIPARSPATPGTPLLAAMGLVAFAMLGLAGALIAGAVRGEKSGAA